MTTITTERTTALLLDGGVSIAFIENLPSGVKVLAVSCPDHETFKHLPHAVSLGLRVYGLTAWSSDAGYAYYRSDATVAVAVIVR